MDKLYYRCFMKIFGILIFLVLFMFQAGISSAQNTALATLTGVVSDVTGAPAAHAEIFIYNTDNIRRPAEFISRATGSDGRYSIQVPAGTYWVVARIRKGEKYGPLNPGDKHSGDPLEISLADGEREEENFVVVNLKETAKLTNKVKESFFKVQGTIYSSEKKPIANAYVFAVIEKVSHGTPDYISAWTRDDGRFELFLPAGRYYFGFASEFPSDDKTAVLKEFEIKGNMMNLELTAEQKQH